MTEWPLFSRLPITVVTVTGDGFPYAAGVAPLPYTETMTGSTQAPEEERRTTLTACEATAKRLRAAGVDATAQMREGDPADQIIAVAREREAGLIVVGTRGQTGLIRVVLGSVARNVLLHATCSVLVVREGARLDGVRIERRREARELVTAFG